ncbi:OPT oligopeptide transporter protein-domain-containing protein [Mycena albidolilacea]|uniref:OPT oligopeptide transporter protein-domain-containing protein n=1 Tax=Mycena albidolilacea TaxID=1033008 RepID=A0AAD7F3Q4_9AGAR|nr:OPT oligopeptide transporter protein-domain-containing protein [Mycena albidolilacea]
MASATRSNEEIPADEKAPPSLLDEKKDLKGDVETAHEPADTEFIVLEDERDIATHVITVADDPSLNPWTLRALILGLGLSALGGVLAEIYYFKPQTVFVSTMFLAIIALALGKFMENFIPTFGFFRYLNPARKHPFNKKENAFVVIMASAAANSALATEVLAVQRLYYNITPNPASSIFLLFASQLAGYGIGGLFRSVLLYPSKMLYPAVLPLVAMFDALYKDAAGSSKKLRLFWIAFTVIFFWEILPEWMFPLLTGFSIFCLANPRSADFTRIFGGSNGNEGLGVLSICFDWQYISGINPMTIPLKAQFSNFVGYILCIIVFVAVYYNNIWNAKTFPFLSQTLFYANGSVYDQLLILNDKFEVDPTLLAEQGLPFYSSTWVVQLLTTNLGMAATFTHLLLWNRDDLRGAWSWMTPSALKRSWADFNWKFWQDDGMRGTPSDEDGDIDPHYKEMLKYPDAPNSWYLATLVLSIIVALVIIYKADSTLPWWGLFISLILASISIVFFGSLYAITGLQFILQPFVQMIGGFIHPSKPVANLYFVLFSYNSVIQAQLLLKDLKIAQYTKLPPKAAFTAQVSGTLFGAVLNYVLMNSIIDNQRPILLSVEGTNIWSGQQPQQYNSQAVAWGGLSHQLFAVNQRYQWVAWAYVVGLFVPVPFWVVYRFWPKLRTDYLYTPVICYYIGWLCVGINSSIFTYFSIAYLSQWWLRTRYPRWFVKYNYILAAALDGGTQVMVFILSFAVQGASGNSHLFPQWWGANQNGTGDGICIKASS